MSTFITVIVPIYNIQREYLERCINSILNQTYTDFELLLVDDGSTDGSGAVADEFAKKDARVRVFHKENGGSSSARNLAIKEAKGEYLSFIDSDDYVEAFFLERLVTPIETAKHEGLTAPRIVQIGRNEIAEDGTCLEDICVPPTEDVYISSKDFFMSLIMHKGDCSFCTKLTSKELFKEREFPVGKLNEDFRLLIDMLLECEGVYSLSIYGYHVFYRMGSNSRKKDKNEFSRVFSDNIENADYVQSLVKDNYPDLADMALRFGLYQRLDYLLHIPIGKMDKNFSEYAECVMFIRGHFAKMLTNKYLTKKNKLYLSLLALNPRVVRKIHAKIRGFE